MALSDIVDVKNLKITMDKGKMVNQTDVLDGEAKDSPVANENNVTEQYRTQNINKGNLGGKNKD